MLYLQNQATGPWTILFLCLLSISRRCDKGSYGYECIFQPVVKSLPTHRDDHPIQATVLILKCSPVAPHGLKSIKHLSGANKVSSVLLRAPHHFHCTLLSYTRLLLVP